MYIALGARVDGPILELAAGSGRICVPLAAAGHRVTAVDRDEDMLARARSAWQERQPAAGGSAGVGSAGGGNGRGSLDFVAADMTKLELPTRFDLAILAFNGLLLLPGRAAQRAAIATMVQHLAPAGRAIVDAWLPSPDDLALYDGRSILEWLRDVEPQTHVAKTTSARYDSASGTAHVMSFFDEWRDGEPPRRTSRSDDIHFVTYSELEGFFEAAGLVVELAAGDYDMTPFSGSSERIVMIGRAGGD